MIILPAIDIKDGNCVRLVKGDYGTAHKVAESYMDTARSFEQAGSQWIHMVDLDGAKDASTANKEIFLDVAKNTRLKVEVGGGIRNLDTVEMYLSGGVSRVIIGSAAVKNPQLVKDAVKEYGDRIAVGIDAKNGYVATEGWLETSDVYFTELAKRMSDEGVKYIIFTDISKDGTLSGVNAVQLDEINKACSANIIASGGVHTIDDIITCRKLGLYGTICGKSLYQGTLDLKQALVKGVNFEGIKEVGDPVECAEEYNAQGADEICFLDITATHEGRGTMVDVVRRTAQRVFVPLTVGGGISSVDDFRELLRSGADKVSVNSAAVRNPQLIHDAAEIFGSQCVVVAIDAKKKGDSWTVVVNGGRIDMNIDAIEWAKKAEELGAGEILLTSMDTDGMKTGFDIELLNAVCDVVKIPVIASGGCGTLEHFSEVFQKTKASAALAASLFHYKELTVSQVKEHLEENNIPVRRVD